MTVSASPCSDPFGADWLGNVWRESFLVGFGNRVTRPSRGELAKLVDAIDTHSDRDGTLVDREVWLRAAVVRWAATSPTKRSLFGFVDWVDGGQRTNGTGDHFRDKRIAAEDAQEERVRAARRREAQIKRDSEALRERMERDEQGCVEGSGGSGP